MVNGLLKCLAQGHFVIWTTCNLRYRDDVVRGGLGQIDIPSSMETVRIVLKYLPRPASTAFNQNSLGGCCTVLRQKQTIFVFDYKTNIITVLIFLI